LEETSDEEERLALYHKLLNISQRISEERLAINLLGKLASNLQYLVSFIHSFLVKKMATQLLCFQSESS